MTEVELMVLAKRVMESRGSRGRGLAAALSAGHQLPLRIETLIVGLADRWLERGL